jgi:hypothetical protein
MQNINWQEVIASILTAWLFLQRTWVNVSKIVEPIVKEIDLRAQTDPTFHKEDRKALALRAIQLLKDNGDIKLGFIGNFIVSKVIDEVAMKLPDFTVTPKVKDLLDKVSQ